MTSRRKFPPGAIVRRDLDYRPATTWRCILPNGDAQLILSDAKPLKIISLAATVLLQEYYRVPDDEVPPHIWAALAKLKLQGGV